MLIFSLNRIGINGEMWIWDEKLEELRVYQTRKGREKDKEQVNEKEGNASKFTEGKKE